MTIPRQGIRLGKFQPIRGGHIEMSDWLARVDQPVFFDCEVSAPDGCIIGVGWAYFEGTQMVTESHLVVPDPEWAIEQSWDTEAEQVHGITLEQLRKEGAPAFNVARRMNEVLWHRDLFSDSPRDRTKLKQLFEVADIEMDFSIREMPARTLIEKRAVESRLTKTQFDGMQEKICTQFPCANRAGPDSRQWAALWEAVAALSA